MQIRGKGYFVKKKKRYHQNKLKQTDALFGNQFIGIVFDTVHQQSDSSQNIYEEDSYNEIDQK